MCCDACPRPTSALIAHAALAVGRRAGRAQRAAAAAAALAARLAQRAGVGAADGAALELEAARPLLARDARRARRPAPQDAARRGDAGAATRARRHAAGADEAAAALIAVSPTVPQVPRAHDARAERPRRATHEDVRGANGRPAPPRGRYCEDAVATTVAVGARRRLARTRAARDEGGSLAAGMRARRRPSNRLRHRVPHRARDAAQLHAVVGAQHRRQSVAGADEDVAEADGQWRERRGRPPREAERAGRDHLGVRRTLVQGTRGLDRSGEALARQNRLKCGGRGGSRDGEVRRLSRYQRRRRRACARTCALQAHAVVVVRWRRGEARCRGSSRRSVREILRSLLIPSAGEVSEVVQPCRELADRVRGAQRDGVHALCRGDAANAERRPLLRRGRRWPGTDRRAGARCSTITCACCADARWDVQDEMMRARRRVQRGSSRLGCRRRDEGVDAVHPTPRARPRIRGAVTRVTIVVNITDATGASAALAAAPTHGR
mmetsp:Transcript_21160/g.74625  ORF Transcript_21160/g.74625 Transcript_21160/m.74625 type:complete len:495 (+) Transcript_21160:182-1666(+)